MQEQLFRRFTISNSPRDLVLALIPEDGSTIGNSARLAQLREDLPDLTDEDYHAVRDQLIAEGILAFGRGQGGSVSRSGLDGAKADTPAKLQAAPIASGSGSSAISAAFSSCAVAPPSAAPKPAAAIAEAQPSSP
jgi:adenine-specific DNA-methyltransferase